MTLVLQGAGALQQIQLGVNELAASLFVGKYVGSILTRKQDAKLFQVLEGEFGVKVKEVPAWLENVQLDRKFCILGEGLRRIEGKSSMKNVEMNTLEGLATFLVLCSRYSISDKAIVKLLEVFLLGGLGAIDRGKLQDEALPYTLKPLVAAFIRSTKDADAASKQNAKAQAWMSELLLSVDLPRYCFSTKNSQHVFVRLSQFMGDLLGVSTVQEEFIKHTKAPQLNNQNYAKDRSRRIHETVSLDVANVALLAAANGADLCVECMTETTQIILPSHMKPADTKFLVRLWLTQPPANVSQILKMSDPVEKTTYLSSYDNMENESHTALTVFGGATELAAAVSSAFGYTAEALGGSSHQCISEMWDKALKKGKSFSWAVKPMPNLLYPLRFHFLLPDRRLDPHETMLANAISKMDSRMAPLSREIASIIDELYRWKSYTNHAFESEWISAVKVINVGLAVGALHTITQPLAPDDAQYALSLQSIGHNGALSDLCPNALTEGVSHQELIWAASTLWGGASIASQGNASINDSVQGVVAPHCVIILDVIRNPLQFVRKGMSGKLLTMCRGSVPLLARDPNNGFVLAPDSKYSEPDRQDLVVERVNEADQITEMNTDMVITFEPDVLGYSPFRSHFCCWCLGNLAFEVCPITVFKNILRRGTESTRHDNPVGLPRSDVANGEVLMKTLGWIELLSLKKYRVKGGVVILNAHDRAGWLISMAGLAAPGKTVFQRLGGVDLSLCQIESEDTVLLSTLH